MMASVISDQVIEAIEASHGSALIEQIANEISEMMWNRDHKVDIPEGNDGAVYVSDIQMIDACNHVATGTFWAGGTEYSFEVESGNNAGFVWRMVSADEPVPEIQIKHTEWALAPRDDIRHKHIDAGKEAFLLAKWDALLERPDVADIPRKYGYDRMFSPGLKTESYWREQADKVGFDLVPKPRAEDLRATLKEQAKRAT